jgi:hypothetical protein
MNTSSTIPTGPSSSAGATDRCPSWCRVDHESGARGCQTERRAVVRVPAASLHEVSTVHAFRVAEGCGTGVVIQGKPFTQEAAREYALKILDVLDTVNMDAAR